MSDGIATSLISAAALLLVAFITFILNRRMQIAAAWREEKLRYYRELVESLSLIIQGEDSKDGHIKFARAKNNAHLIGSEQVLRVMHAYADHISIRNTDRDFSLDRKLMADLIRAVRVDLKIPEAAKLTEDLMVFYSAGVENNPRWKR